MFNRETYIARRKKLKEMISDGIILLPGNVDSPMNYADNTYYFRQDSSFLYFFGLDFQKLAAVIDTQSGEEILFGDDVDMEDIIWMGPQISLKEKAEKVGISKTGPYKGLKETIETGRKIHFLPPYRAENKLLLNELLGISVSKLKAYSSLELIKAIVALRSVKEDQEVAEIRKACAVGYQMHVAAMKMAQAGVWEQSIAGTIEGIANAGGGMVSFPVILSQNGETLIRKPYKTVGYYLLMPALRSVRTMPPILLERFRLVANSHLNSAKFTKLYWLQTIADVS